MVKWMNNDVSFLNKVQFWMSENYVFEIRSGIFVKDAL